MQFDARLTVAPQAEARRQIRTWPSDLPILLLSAGLQVVLGILFGHAYDTRIFMAAGHQVAIGANPYIAEDLSAVFENPSFRDITTVGYPPPWPIILGSLYRLSYHSPADFLAYNAAIKVPIILANILLAYLAAGCVRRLGADAARARRAWIFLLLNPFLLYASAAWGQFDSIVAVLSLASLLLLDARRPFTSALLLALAISFKPTAIPLLLIPFFHRRTVEAGWRWRFYVTALLGVAAFAVAPFSLLGWDPSPILQNWNAHFVVGGGLTPLAAMELMQESYVIPGVWWLTGLLWIPALAFAAFKLRSGIGDLGDVLGRGVAVIMVFFLARSWLSEPNIILVFPLVVILAHTGVLPYRWLHAIWLLPLLFGVVNVSLAQIFFPSMPDIMDAFLRQMWQMDTARLIAKVVIVVPWQIVGWSIVVRLLGPVVGPQVATTS